MSPAVLLLSLSLAQAARADDDDDWQAFEEFDPTPLPSRSWHDEAFARELHRRRVFNGVVLASPLTFAAVGAAMTVKQCNRPTHDKEGNDTCLFPVLYGPFVGVGVIALVLPYGTLRVQRTLEPFGGPTDTAAKVGIAGPAAGLVVTVLSGGGAAAYALPVGLTMGLAGGIGQGIENAGCIHRRGSRELALQVSPRSGPEGWGMQVDGRF